MSRKNKIILLTSLLIGGLFSIFASASPDGLEKVAEDHGFIADGFSLISGIIPDYAIPYINYEPLAVALAGVFGTMITFCLIIILSKILVRFSKL